MDEDTTLLMEPSISVVLRPWTENHPLYLPFSMSVPSGVLYYVVISHLHHHRSLSSPFPALP